MSMHFWLPYFSSTGHLCNDTPCMVRIVRKRGSWLQSWQQYVRVRRLNCGLQVLAALFVLVPFCYLSGSFTINPVTEASSQARHLQLLSGCPPLIYWAGFYVRALLYCMHCTACTGV